MDHWISDFDPVGSQGLGGCQGWGHPGRPSTELRGSRRLRPSASILKGFPAALRALPVGTPGHRHLTRMRRCAWADTRPARSGGSRIYLEAGTRAASRPSAPRRPPYRALPEVEWRVGRAAPSRPRLFPGPAGAPLPLLNLAPGQGGRHSTGRGRCSGRAVGGARVTRGRHEEGPGCGCCEGHIRLLGTTAWELRRGNRGVAPFFLAGLPHQRPSDLEFP